MDQVAIRPWRGGGGKDQRCSGTANLSVNHVLIPKFFTEASASVASMVATPLAV